MANEKNKKYGLRIFCVYFENNDPKYFKSNAKDTLEKLSIYGNTDHYYYSDTREILIDQFEKISHFIEKNYKLKINCN